MSILDIQILLKVSVYWKMTTIVFDLMLDSSTTAMVVGDLPFSTTSTPYFLTCSIHRYDVFDSQTLANGFNQK